MKVQWNTLHAIDDVEQVKESSKVRPCLIFKHSTRCNISSLAKYRLEDDWSFGADTLDPYYLDLIAHRNVSHYIAETFQVHHESPQVLLIIGGECVYDASHLDITVRELQEALAAAVTG